MATRWWSTPSDSTTNSGSISAGTRIPSSFTPSNASRGPIWAALDIETQIIDPVAYTKPFKIKFTATLRPGEELMEYICQENQQDAQHLQGPAGPPKIRLYQP